MNSPVPPTLLRPSAPTFSTSTPAPDSHSAVLPAEQRQPRRGDIWFVSKQSANEQLGEHHAVGTEIWSNKLAVIVSNDRMNASSGFVQIVYLTTAERRTRRPTRMHIGLELPDGRSTPAVAFCEQVHSVDLTRLTTYRGRIAREAMTQIDEALLWGLGLQFTD